MNDSGENPRLGFCLALALSGLAVGVIAPADCLVIAIAAAGAAVVLYAVSITRERRSAPRMGGIMEGAMRAVASEYVKRARRSGGLAKMRRAMRCHVLGGCMVVAGLVGGFFGPPALVGWYVAAIYFGYATMTRGDVLEREVELARKPEPPKRPVVVVHVGKPLAPTLHVGKAPGGVGVVVKSSDDKPRPGGFTPGMLN